MKKTNRLLINCFGLFPSHAPVSPSLTQGILKRRGVETSQLDINYLLWNYLLSPESLSKRKYHPEFLGNPGCPFSPTFSRHEFEITKKLIIDNIEIAKSILKDKKKFYAIQKQNWALYTVYQAQQIIYHDTGTFITNHNIHWPFMGSDIHNLDHIDQLSEMEDRNPLYSPVNEFIIPIIVSMAPKWIGMDIVFPWEIVGALTVNKLLKKHLPHTHLTYTGHGFDEFTFSRIRDRVSKDERFFFGFDSIFLSRHDEGLVQLGLLDDFNGKTLSKIPNLAYREGSQIIVPERIECHIIEALPDFSDLELSQYYAPYPVLINRFSYKCFWSSCSYCSINNVYKERQHMPVKNDKERLIHYAQTLNIRHLWILDEAATPDFARQFSNFLLEKKLDFCWSLRTRIDSGYDKELLSLMHQAGCHELWIGLEAVTPKVLKIMNKTDDPSHYAAIASQIMKSCHETGIGIHFCLMFGVPGEDDSDRDSLVKFFEDTKNYYRNSPLYATFNYFSLMPGSYIHRHPDQFGIQNIEPPENGFYMIDLPYTTVTGIPWNAREKLDRLDKTVEKLIQLFTPNESLAISWFYSRDSVYELLLKEHFAKYPGNPYLKNPNKIETFFLKLIKLSGKSVFATAVLNKLIRYMMKR
ncbi:MAG: B12-binding domain-containing radical SAM protein [Candidatus Omnitrophota bacterium]